MNDMNDVALVALGSAMTGAVTLFLWMARPVFEVAAAARSARQVEFTYLQVRQEESNYLYAQSLSSRALILREGVYWAMTDLPFELVPETKDKVHVLRPMDVVVVGSLPATPFALAAPLRVTFRTQSLLSYGWLPRWLRDHMTRRFTILIKGAGPGSQGRDGTHSLSTEVLS
jgi:hypothetical protein